MKRLLKSNQESDILISMIIQLFVVHTPRWGSRQSSDIPVLPSAHFSWYEQPNCAAYHRSSAGGCSRGRYGDKTGTWPLVVHRLGNKHHTSPLCIVLTASSPEGARHLGTERGEMVPGPVANVTPYKYMNIYIRRVLACQLDLLDHTQLHTITVYTLYNFAVYYSTCRVFSLYLLKIPVPTAATNSYGISCHHSLSVNYLLELSHHGCRRPSYTAREQTTKKTPSPILPLLYDVFTGMDPKENISSFYCVP
jgi:hypothetical protein